MMKQMWNLDDESLADEETHNSWTHKIIVQNQVWLETYLESST